MIEVGNQGHGPGERSHGSRWTGGRSSSRGLLRVRNAISGVCGNDIAGTLCKEYIAI